MYSPWFLLVYSCCMMGCITMAAQTNSNLTTDESALLALKALITSDPQNTMSNWSTTIPVCNWVGVTCGAHHHRVAHLNISYFGLTGTVPPELGNLSFLAQLSFANNSFHGALPSEFAYLRRLKFLSLKNNNFKGFIPSWFGSLTKLQTFNLYGNQFSGSIPAAIFNLSALQEMDLSYNQLSGSIPGEIGNLTVLKEIYLGGNKFKEIPKEIGNLNQLEKLNVVYSTLEGHVPLAVYNMSSLNLLALAKNNLNGSVPDNICQHLPKLQGLYLSNNNFHGRLPSKWSQCKHLQVLSLGFNNFTGSIPKDIGNLTQIETIYLGSNYLTGTIPDEIGHLPRLQELVLGGNNLSGIIPTSIFNMSTVSIISLDSNQFSGNLPANLGLDIPNIQQFLVGANKLSGTIPRSISNASKLTDLDLVSNSFSGFIPSSLCALGNLERLNLGHNNLAIDISTEERNFLSCLGSLRNLRILAFPSNPLKAPLPMSFGNFSTSLETIELSNCSLRGYIPSDIGNLSTLTRIALDYNLLSGSIPTSVGRLNGLQGLFLHENKLQGYIPEEVCQLKNLDSLILVDNQLSGSIPSCLGDLGQALRSLYLGSNLLTSIIPSTLWKLTDIMALDLSSNSLIGPISEGIGNMKVATYIDISNNHLSGTIPSSIGGLQSLREFYLANNSLEGPIPSSIGNALSLESLDLSQNHLSGAIPKSLEALSYLQYLNFSLNKLHGEIPTGGPFRNLSAESFISNRGLCGASQFQVPACKKKTGIILKYVLPGILSAMLLVTFIWILILRRKKVKAAATETTILPQVLWRRISYTELLSATNGFTEGSLLGSGSFGSVYKGTLADGMEVAVKVFNLELEGAFTSFDTECELLSNLRHRNLIKVISCCSQIDFKALVLNYMPNGSLDKWLYVQNFSLNILQRLNILIDVASALEYLHHGYETPIVHCDLKPSNILLDDAMGAHVADFGIAKLLAGGDSMTRTMTQATIGYMAPEYGIEGMVTRRGDVYSFGIVMMETFTRRKPTAEIFGGEISIKQWVANSLDTGAIVEVVDATLLGIEEEHDFVSKRECSSSVMKLAVACSAESPEDRVDMQEALATLKKIKIKFLKDTGGGVKQPSSSRI